MSLAGYSAGIDDNVVVAVGGLVQTHFELESRSGGISDVNLSGKVDASDIQLVINRVLGIDTEWNCDINNSGAVDAVDVQLVINAVLGIGI